MLFLVRYGEIGLKSSQVRRRLRDRLITNIQDSFLNENVECITSSEEGRVYVRSQEEDVARRILPRTFGVVSFSPVIECSSDMKEVIENVLEHYRDDLEKGGKFAIRARRSGSHPYTSQELAREIGSSVLSRFKGMGVNLTKPDIEIFVEVRGGVCYLYRQVIPGPGGFPLGSQGRVLGVVRNVNDAISCWLMMKRGCKVHFAYTDPNRLVEVLETWDPKPRSHKMDDEDEIDELARKIGALGVVYGNDIENLNFKKRENLATFYPIVGFSPKDISTLASRIGL